MSSLREEIENILADHRIFKGEITPAIENIKDLFTTWALEMVGENLKIEDFDSSDQSKWGEGYYDTLEWRTMHINHEKYLIRNRIEESTK